MPAGRLSALDRHLQHLQHARVALVEVEGHDLAVPIDAERELRQVVGADREAVEELRELGHLDHVVGDLAHHVDLQPVLAALEAVVCHGLEDTLALVDTPAEGDHQLEVRQAHVLAHALHRRALQGEALGVGGVGVA